MQARIKSPNLNNVKKNFKPLGKQTGSEIIQQVIGYAGGAYGRSLAVEINLESSA